MSRKYHLPHEEFRARGYLETTTPYFSLKARQNSLKRYRLSVVIGAASIKRAAQRNFWRRQVKSVFLESPQKNFDFLVVLRPHATPPSKRVFRKKLNEAIISLTSQP